VYGAGNGRTKAPRHKATHSICESKGAGMRRRQRTQVRGGLGKVDPCDPECPVPLIPWEVGGRALSCHTRHLCEAPRAVCGGACLEAGALLSGPLCAVGGGHSFS
jgi:hypothetical protein